MPWGLHIGLSNPPIKVFLFLSIDQSFIEYPMTQASEKGRNVQGTHSFISDTPLSTNTHILNAQQNIQYNSNSGLNSTMPLKFTQNGNMEMRQGKQTENAHAYENDAYNTHITPYSQSKKVKESQNRTNS